MTTEWYKWIPEVILGVSAAAYVVWKVLRLVFRVDRALPTLLGIADQFQVNGGKSLKDDINTLKTQSEDHGIRLARVEGILIGARAPSLAAGD